MDKKEQSDRQKNPLTFLKKSQSFNHNMNSSNIRILSCLFIHSPFHFSLLHFICPFPSFFFPSPVYSSLPLFICPSASLFVHFPIRSSLFCLSVSSPVYSPIPPFSSPSPPFFRCSRVREKWERHVLS